jgi:hypothetical protein
MLVCWKVLLLLQRVVMPGTRSAPPHHPHRCHHHHQRYGQHPLMLLQ